MNRSIKSYYKTVDEDRRNKVSNNIPSTSVQIGGHKSSSGSKNYKMQNTSRNHQSQHPDNAQTRSKVTSTPENNASTANDFDETPLYAHSSWVLPPKISSTVTHTSVPQTSPMPLTISTEAMLVTASSSSAVEVAALNELSTSPSSSSLDSFLLRGWSPVPTTSTDTSHWLTKMNCRNVTRKRKRQHLIKNADEDPDFGSEPPSAKRKQAQPSPYKSDVSSVASSVYPSPVDVFPHEIDTHSSYDYLSAEANFNITADCIPDSPNSLQLDDEVRAEDDELVSATTSPSTCSISSSKEAHHLFELHTVTQLGERTPGQLTLISVNSEINPNYESSKSFKPFADYAGMQYSCMTPGAEPDELRQCPLPALSWANADDVWQLMCKKDQQAACLRSGSMLERHSSLQPRMRAILLDWLIEVCEVYKLHRETYYLAVDYLDRYLSVQKNIQKTHLQLIGITCLFVAAKVEEIYPPKIGEFAYVTDGACQESDILQHEVLLLQTLEWSINPVTPMGWLGVYMQLNVNNRTPASFKRNLSKAKTSVLTNNEDTNDAFIYPQFSGMEFVQTAQLLDLCSLDLGIADYGYSIIAAAAMSHTFNREIALRCSGFDWQTIEPCARWMQPYFQVVREESVYLSLIEQNDQVTNRFGLGHICPNIVTDDSHIIQTHTISMGMFDRVAQLQEHVLAAKIRTEASPATGLLCPEGLLTPPASSRKPIDATDVDDEHEPDSVERIKTTVTCTNPIANCKSSDNDVKLSSEDVPT
ncbi:G1/S-specific cyclin-E [Eurosta solidaginis]|uniref:G1/S-specific cyclin-E n=1 Tax=Eurosta solidaginis TaxID=178769 RepID=UPI0035307CA8